MTFDTNGRTMMGFSPQELVELYRETVPKLVAFGANCGIGPSDLVGTIIAMNSYIEPSDILVAKANCGIPEFKGDTIQYSGTPELMAEYAKLALDVGARIIGGCCGTTPSHLATMHKALESHHVQLSQDLDSVVQRLGPVTAGTRLCCDGLSVAKQKVSRKKRNRRRVS